MAALETGLDWLRPLINNNPWDFSVIWKLGDDPSRFIEWRGCCCSGGNKAEIIKIKDENDLEKHLIVECKDKFVKHPVRTNSCKKIAELPSVIPLYSGIHGDVVISKQPRWTSDHELNGTQVLVPIAGGLIELFSTKNVPKDEKIIDYISARFRLSFKQENMHNLEKQFCDPHDYWLSLVHNLNFPQPNNYSSFEGSSTCSSLSNEHQILKLGSDYKTSTSPRLKRKKNTDLALVNGNEKMGGKIRQKAEKGPYKSKNLVTERNRRKRIKDGMFALRALVPKISKMDRASTLGDAAEYIKELEETIKNYHQELRAMEEEDYERANAKPDVTRSITDEETGANEKTSTEVQVEVSQVGSNGFLVKLVCNKKRGGFSRLMETMDSLGLHVTDANVTTLNGSVLNLLRAENANGGTYFEAFTDAAGKLDNEEHRKPWK